jgi:hypothetical protein
MRGVRKPRTIREAKQLCKGCRNDRYNHPGTCERSGIDAPVVSDQCWLLRLDKMLYCRPMREWVMPCHSGQRERWVADYARTGVKPRWSWT